MSFHFLCFFGCLAAHRYLFPNFVAKNLEHEISALILLFSTIIYGIAYIGVLCQMVFVDGWMFVMLFIIGILSLPVMIPAWIAALLLNRYYVTKTPHPGTAARNTNAFTTET